MPDLTHKFIENFAPGWYRCLCGMEVAGNAMKDRFKGLECPLRVREHLTSKQPKPMDAKIIEGVCGVCWCKFLVARFGEVEWEHLSKVDTGRRVLGGHHPSDILVLDLGTNEGAVFHPGGHAPSDLRSHGIWTSPLFGGFLTWLYKQPLGDLTKLPDLVGITGSFGGERGRPLDELLKVCLRSNDKEIKGLARGVWQGEHGDTTPPGTPPRLADVQQWVGNGPVRFILAPK
jgi:hypothetical protein